MAWRRLGRSLRCGDGTLQLSANPGAPGLWQDRCRLRSWPNYMSGLPSRTRTPISRFEPMNIGAGHSCVLPPRRRVGRAVALRRHQAARGLRALRTASRRRPSRIGGALGGSKSAHLPSARRPARALELVRQGNPVRRLGSSPPLSTSVRAAGRARPRLDADARRAALAGTRP